MRCTAAMARKVRTVVGSMTVEKLSVKSIPSTTSIEGRMCLYLPLYNTMVYLFHNYLTFLFMLLSHPEEFLWLMVWPLCVGRLCKLSLKGFRLCHLGRCSTSGVKSRKCDMEVWLTRSSGYTWGGYRCSCDICARAKMHQISFAAVRDRLDGLSPGARMSADVLIMHIIPSRVGYYHSVFIIVDHATTMCWMIPLKSSESNHILAHCKRGVTVS